MAWVAHVWPRLAGGHYLVCARWAVDSKTNLIKQFRWLRTTLAKDLCRKTRANPKQRTLSTRKARPTFALRTDKQARWEHEVANVQIQPAPVAVTCFAVDAASEPNGKNKNAVASSTGAAMSSAKSVDDLCFYATNCKWAIWLPYTLWTRPTTANLIVNCIFPKWLIYLTFKCLCFVKALIFSSNMHLLCLGAPFALFTLQSFLIYLDYIYLFFVM